MRSAAVVVSSRLPLLQRVSIRLVRLGIAGCGGKKVQRHETWAVAGLKEEKDWRRDVVRVSVLNSAGHQDDEVEWSLVFPPH